MPLTCNEISEQDTVERYLSGSLPQPELTAFEEHFFGCDSCFGYLEAARVSQDVLSRFAERRRQQPVIHRNWRLWAGAAAAVLLLVWIAALNRNPHPEVGRVSQPAARVEQRASLNWAELGQITPPVYVQVIHRGANETGDRAFDGAMRFYQHNDYSRAAEVLRTVLQTRPQNLAAHLYLGICELMLHQPAEAKQDFQAIIAAGDTPFLEEAHFYRAKALLREHDLAGAQEELQGTIALRGDLEQQARSLLQKLP